MEQMSIREIKSMNHYFYYSNGRLIKTNTQHKKIPIELFEDTRKKTNYTFPIYSNQNTFYSTMKTGIMSEYNGLYKSQISTLLEHFDYVSMTHLKEQFAGYSYLSKERLKKVKDVSFLASISIEEKIERFNQLFMKYNIKLLNEDSSLKSIPIPCMISDDLIVAETSKEVRLQHYFKSLEHHLNDCYINENWIVTDSFNLLNQKFSDYFLTELMDQIESERLNINSFDEYLPNDLSEPLFVFAKNVFGYSGYLKKSDSSRISSIQFGSTKPILKELLYKEFIARYAQNDRIIPIPKERYPAKSLDIFSIDSLQDIGVFLFCFDLEREE